MTFLLLVAVGKASADEASSTAQVDWQLEATNHLGVWIWDTNAFDKQTVHFWKEFQIPSGETITNAMVRITGDNGYVLYLDGEELGRGSDWRTVTEYDVTQLLGPGRHVLTVEGFNDRLEGGLIFGLRIEAENLPALEVLSDDTWRVLPPVDRNWLEQNSRQPPVIG